MPASAIALMITVVATLGLGVLVLLANSGRNQNRAFFFQAICLSLWGFAVLCAVGSSHDRTAADLSIRAACYISTLIPLSFHFLCLSILLPDKRLWQIVWRMRAHILVCQIVGLSIFTKFFMKGVLMPGDAGHEGQLAIPVYGPGLHLMNAYISIALIGLIVLYSYRLRVLEGIRRAEIQFFLLGMGIAAFLAIITQMIVPLLTGSQATQQYGPVAILPMNVTIAYGIATRRMLDMPTVLQRISAYSILAGYLTLLYLAVYYFAVAIFGAVGDEVHNIEHLVAALVVAFSMAPMHSVFQRVARRLFINTQSPDIGRMVRTGRERFATLATIDAMLQELHDVIAQGGLDPAGVHLLLSQGESYVEHLPMASTGSPLMLEASRGLPVYLEHAGAPLGMETASRLRPTPELTEAMVDMKTCRATLAVGLFTKKDLRGIILLEQRNSGRIYSVSDQDSLQILCDQMAIALENAQLYTELQNSKLYNEIMLDNLVSGVIAIDRQKQITTINREAQRITGLLPASAIHESFECLPPVLTDALEKLLAEPNTVWEEEAIIEQQDGSEIPVRLGGTVFRGHHGDVLGALVLFNDLTRMKALETQVRRADRLASIGTLSAGMAHEIKNPLVTIKTFTQLLPERYMDEDFRDTFSDLISQEVNRIDSIVNQLLHFSRPAKPYLKPTSLHDLITASLRLANEQLKQKGINLVTDLRAEDHVIHADADLLTQAFINFLLNAIQSMGRNGMLTVSTQATQPMWDVEADTGLGKKQDFIRLDIEDTGEGIPDDVLTHIFDPFYTTKEEGTGLGLSVSHGIIQDHRGYIDVESEPGTGTIFHIFFPVHKEETVLS